jgi:hypothetical protein
MEMAEEALDFLAAQTYQGEPILHAIACCDFVSKQRMAKALAARLEPLLCAAREGEGWRPITEAEDGVRLDQVGCHHPGTKNGWLRGDGFYKREAITSGFTHFFTFPPPPPREVKP